MKKIGIGLFLITSSLLAEAQLSVGTMAPNISLPGIKDSVTDLSSFKGKVVLLDFWASWCLPCRAVNPSIERLYIKYKSKGLVILAVSIDNNKDKWVKAIKQDKLTYTMLNDKDGWNSKVAEAYDVNEMPANFLIDKEGKIVAVNMEGMKLDKKVKMMLQ